MSDTDAERSRRKRLHAVGDHSMCRAGRCPAAGTVGAVVVTAASNPRHVTEQRGWSYTGLAQRMTAQGCAIDQSALYKIEKGNPRRRISVDELVALREVFAQADDPLTMEELLGAARAGGEANRCGGT